MDIFGAIFLGVALVFGLCAGTIIERRHLRSLAIREAELADIVVTNFRHIPSPETVVSAALVSGSMVAAGDYFKAFVSNLRNIVGGEMKSLRTVMERARREATVRLLLEARSLGATEVYNIRYGTSNIASQSGKKGMISVEVFAYGTAVRRR